MTLTSLRANITLRVPRGFGMDLDLEIAYTRNSRQEYRIDAPRGLKPTVSPDRDYDKGSPRRYIRAAGAVNGGGNKVKIEAVHGNITVKGKRLRRAVPGASEVTRRRQGCSAAARSPARRQFVPATLSLRRTVFLGAGVSLPTSLTMAVTNFLVPAPSKAIVVCRAFVSTIVPSP